ncbi:MAG: bifunctional nuclease family protein [Betaproteobacteria bacterium]|nr:bifunctional nuclease family protein [Betaproteobacteria bacterium]
MRARTGEIWRLAAAMMAIALAAPACAAETPSEDNVRVQSVEVVASALGAVVLLKVDNKAIPVFVDQTVAASIHAALTRSKLPRPLSHDLMHSILESYGGKVTQVVVTLREATFYGALSIDLGGEAKVFDARSSDAIALAIHFSAPILVGRSLLESAGRELGDPPGSQRL